MLPHMDRQAMQLWDTSYELHLKGGAHGDVPQQTARWQPKTHYQAAVSIRRVKKKDRLLLGDQRLLPGGQISRPAD